jgi:hypothetical protein
LLFAVIALDAGGNLVQSLLNAPDLLALPLHPGTQPATLALHLAKVAIERGEIRPLLQRRLPDGYAGKDGQ